MVTKISSGSKVMDELLNGGYETDVLTTIYGPGGVGKTCLCLLAAIGIAKAGKRVVYMDTEGNFSVERLKQLEPDHKAIMEKIIFFKPLTFDKQKKAFSVLRSTVDDKVGLIVIDTIAMLYRLEMGKAAEVLKVNRELGRQLAYLTEIAREKNIPVLVTNQVYSDFEDRDTVRMVGGDILKYGSKCLIELIKYRKNKRKAVLRKHRSLPEEREAVFEIQEKGIA